MLGWGICLGLNLGVLALVLHNAKRWPRVTPLANGSQHGVSVLIPARNEEKNIQRVLTSVLDQPGVEEVLVYDDHSTDRTAHLVLEVAKRDTRVRLVAPEPLPPDWVAKPFACWQLAQRATAPWLLFLDADAELSPNAIPAILHAAEHHQATFLSCWPHLELRGWAEKIFMPLLNFVVFSLFPASLSFRMKLPSLGLAHGACILAKREIYLQIGGHQRVKTELFEDTALARAWRAAGFWGICLDGSEAVRVRMYESLENIWHGFEKIAYPAFRHKFNFGLFVLFHFALFVLPFAAAVGSTLGGAFLPLPWACVMTAVLARIVQAIRFGYPISSAFLHPVAESGLVLLSLRSAFKCVMGQGVRWKGRTYQHVTRTKA